MHVYKILHEQIEGSSETIYKEKNKFHTFLFNSNSTLSIVFINYLVNLYYKITI